MCMYICIYIMQVQMSQEMWEFSPDGDLKFETFLNHFTQAPNLNLIPDCS